jgi:hypothetical protein
MTQLLTMAHNEICALHRFFAEWMRYPIDLSHDFSICEMAFAADFRMVTPAGVVKQRCEVVDWLRNAHGAFPSDFSIDVLDARPIWLGDRAVLVTYVEQQHQAGRMTRRHSCAVLTRDAAAPRGMVWRYLQETWMSDVQSDRRFESDAKWRHS